MYIFVVGYSIVQCFKEKWEKFWPTWTPLCDVLLMMKPIYCYIYHGDSQGSGKLKKHSTNNP